MKICSRWWRIWCLSCVLYIVLIKLKEIILNSPITGSYTQQHHTMHWAYSTYKCWAEGANKMEGSYSGYPWGVYTSTADRTDGRPTMQYDLFTQPLQNQCLYFSRHICYCLILKKKVAEQRIMKSKPNTRSQQAPGKKHTVSILISRTESRNMASVTHHLPSLLSFCGA